MSVKRKPQRRRASDTEQNPPSDASCNQREQIDDDANVSPDFAAMGRQTKVGIRIRE